MTLTVFIVIMTETLPAGLLSEIAGDLGTTEAAAGQLVSAYALGTIVAAIPATALTRALRRRPVLLIGIVGFLVANAVTALSPWYLLALAARFVAGAFSGLIWGMIPGYASRLVPEALRGRAIATVMVGTPLALSIGTPLGTLAGTVVGWRWTFAAMSVVCVGLIAWVRFGVPDAAGQTFGTRTPLHRVLRIPGLVPVLAVVVGWMLAHTILYTYVAPYLASTGVQLGSGQALFVFGLSALVGIGLTSALIDRALRRLVLGSLLGFAVASLVLGLASGNGPALIFAIVLWGITFGGAGPQLQAASAAAAGPDADLAQSVLATVWNGAIFGGGALGGVLLDSAGPGALPWTLLVLLLPALVVAAASRRHAFP
jgi:predicted MFS family arabinose efflux permease